MKNQQLKAEIHDIVNQLNDPIILLKVHKMVSGYKDDQNIIGLSSADKPITKQALVNRILKSREDVQNGNFTTHEDLKKESETW